MDGKTSFEQLCAGQTGFAYDSSSMAKLNKEESYNDLLFKLTTKCETNLLFLPSPTATVSQFTIDIVPDVSNTAVAAAWQRCEKQGYDGLNVIATLDISNMPNNNCTSKYTFAQFVNSLIHSVESYFMFQRTNPNFLLNALNLWKDPESDKMKSCAVVLAWVFERQPIPVKDLMSRSPLSQINSRVSQVIEERDKLQASRRKTLPPNESSKPVTPTKRGRRSVAPSATARRLEEESAEEDDPDISFKSKPEQKMPTVLYLQNMTPEKASNGPEKASAEKAEPMQVEENELEPYAMEDLTLGFEKPKLKTAGRKSAAGNKSTGRKSLVPDWPEEQKEDILFFYDNLNPSQTEQSCIALTCKYASIQYDCELPSKILYQWVQKKGRPIQKTVTKYELPDIELKEASLEFFEKLNKDIGETSRVAFTCKFLHTQFNATISSKQLYAWLNDKGKKTPKRR